MIAALDTRQPHQPPKKTRRQSMQQAAPSLKARSAKLTPWLGRSSLAMIAVIAVLGFGGSARAQTAPASPPAPAENATPTPDNAVMLTVFFKHDQSRPLSELNAQLDRQGFYKAFPPAGVEVVSWYVMMGIGQVVTLRLPASRLREVNRILETTAWGSYRTEFYPTYDYKPTGLASHEKAQSK
jgi:hypothetical protein